MTAEHQKFISELAKAKSMSQNEALEYLLEVAKGRLGALRKYNKMQKGKKKAAKSKEKAPKAPKAPKATVEAKAA